MERHANFALVGVATTLLILVGLVFVVWLGNTRPGQRNDPYAIVFQGPVRGLTKGGEVQFNGIKVGEVKRMRLAPADTSKILVDIEVDAGTPVRTDSRASVEMQGISGINVVQISAGSSRLPLLMNVSSAKPPMIQSQASGMASLLQGGGELVASATQVLGQVNRLMSDRNIANLSGAMADLKSVSGALAENRGMFDRASSALAKLDLAMDDVKGAAASVRGLTDGDGRRAVANAADAAAELKVTLVEARATLKGLSGQAGTTLPAVEATMRSLQDTSETLNGLIRQIRQDPRGTLIKAPMKERELQP